MKLQSLWKAELLADGRYGICLSSRELRAQDTDTKDEDLTFHILRPPYHGYLENTTTGNTHTNAHTHIRFSNRVLEMTALSEFRVLYIQYVVL